MKPWVAIPLANGGFALVDLADSARVARHRWRLARGAVVTSIAGRAVRLARVIACPPRGARVKARNGAAIDCRRANLQVFGSRQELVA